MTSQQQRESKETAKADKKIFRKICGCITGGAIGDAMDIPVETMHYDDAEAQFVPRSTQRMLSSPALGRCRGICESR